MEITIKTTQEEKLNIVHTALCNGLSFMQGYDLEFDIIGDKEQARKNLKEKGKDMCFEDFIIEVIRLDGDLQVKDYNDEQIHHLNLESIEENFDNIVSKHILDVINGHDDAITADCILQTLIYGEVIYG